MRYSRSQTASIVGVLPENLALFDALTVAEHLELTGAVFGISKADTVVRTDQLLRVLRLEQWTRHVHWRNVPTE